MMGEAGGVGDDVGESAVAVESLPLPAGSRALIKDSLQGLLDVGGIAGIVQGIPDMAVECVEDISCGVWPVG